MEKLTVKVEGANKMSEAELTSKSVHIQFKDKLKESVEIMQGTLNSGVTITDGGILLNTKKIRGFEVISDNHRKNADKEIQLPVRGDSRSAGYDIRTPHEVTINPGEKVLIWTDIKAYMLEDEVLNIYVRSSIGTKKGLVLTNTVGIIDSSYYENPDNDGNIGICLKNTSNEVVVLAEQERVCQGVFQKYLVADNDECLNKTRSGGFGSSGTL